ncbi:endonuclease 2-like [Bidens hawaiensis]|uniref:endonuclease 2-like n=1 Tax=Bidens hawaiensis TaxID=980011 RepID=UPI00404AA087
MEFFRSLALVLLFVYVAPVSVRGWGVGGHYMTCKIAQGRLSKTALDAVKSLLPVNVSGDLASWCSWADHVEFQYHWSSPLHYINTPDNLCTYQYRRDCKDEDGEMGRFVSGAITNYTTQLLDYGKQTSQYNLTEALLFLSHFMGDIHQPLHVGFTSDKCGNTIDVNWYTRYTVLHNVWDNNIIVIAEERCYDSNVDNLVDAIETNITSVWADQVQAWEKCSGSQKACPNRYATEGIKDACNWAYKDVENGTVLEDHYFLSRLPIVNMRLAQGGVRLAADLNRIFG